MSKFVLLGCMVVGCFAKEWKMVQPNIATIALGIDFPTTTTGYVAAMRDGFGMAILKTEDRGETVTNTLDNPTATLMMLDIAATDALSSVASGLDLFGFAGSLYTTDGGRGEWGIGTYSKDIFFAGWHSVRTSVDGLCYVQVGDWTVFGEDTEQGISLSCNGGQRWDLLDWGLGSGARYSSFLNGSYGFVSGGGWPSTQKQPFQLTAGGNNTKDQGLLNHPLSDSFAINYPARHVQGTDKQSVVQRSAGERKRNDAYYAKIGRTTDGGLTWDMVFESTGDYYFNQIQFLDENVGLVVGENNRDNNGVIMKTTDGGRTWRTVFQTTRSLVAFYMANEREGWAGGMLVQGYIRAYLVHTTDGGETWTEVPSDLPVAIWNFRGPDPDNLWASGMNDFASALLRYDD